MPIFGTIVWQYFQVPREWSLARIRYYSTYLYPLNDWQGSSDEEEGCRRREGPVREKNEKRSVRKPNQVKYQPHEAVNTHTKSPGCKN